MSSNLPVLVGRVGRPKGSGSKYTDEIAEEICERVANGEVLVAVIEFDRWGNPRNDPAWPSYSTVFDWADPDCPSHVPSFVQDFARARLKGQHCREERCVLLATHTMEGVEETLTHSAKDGMSLRRTRKDMLEHRKLMIHTLQQYNARVNAPKWAERLQQAAPPESVDDNVIIVEGGLPENEPPPPDNPGETPA